MAITLGPKLDLLYNSLISEDYVDSFRLTLQSLDALIQCSVLSASATTPPSNPNPGDAYLLTGGTPSGAWLGQINNIAVWDAQFTLSGSNNVAPQWIFLTPNPGFIVFNLATVSLSVCTASGVWSPISNGVTPVANGGTGSSTVAGAPFAPVQPVASYADPITTGTVTLGAANEAITWEFNLPHQITFSSLAYDVQTADNSGSDSYQIGIYNAAGTLVASTGPQLGTSFSPATGYHIQSLAQGSVTLSAGIYYLVYTGTATTAVLFSTLSLFTPVQAINSGTTSGAALPSTISVPATSQTIGTRPAVYLF